MDHRGKISGKAWTWIAIYLRNLLLHWLMLIPLLAAVLVLPLLAIEIVRRNPDAAFVTAHWPYGICAFALFIIGVALIVLSIHYVSQNLPLTGGNNNQGHFLRGCLLPLVASSIMLTTGWAWYANAHLHLPLYRVGCGSCVAVLSSISSAVLCTCYQRNATRRPQTQPAAIRR